MTRQHSQAPAGKVPSLDKDKYKELLDSLRFDQIDAREANIKTAHAQTCRWLLKKQEYQDWLDLSKLHEHHGLLWIKGKPGAGKSTIMKFVLGKFRRKKEWTISSFFFNARGRQMEKTVQGMYQSLVLQVLTSLPHLQVALDAAPMSDLPIIWTIPLLQSLLRSVVESLGSSRLVCLMDALDECDPAEIRDMVYFFEDLRALALENNTHFHVCFASRHYPYITVRKGVHLILDGQEGHENDIAQYTQDKLNIGNSPTAQTLRAELREKASGIFMWVILVVTILNTKYDDGLSPAALRRELSKLPPDLHTLFREMLQRDNKMRNEMLLCIQWILFSQRPLSPPELYLALHAGIGTDDNDNDNEEIATEWDSNEMTPERVQRFILSASKGLAEVTRTKVPTVQFIHESVNDFLLKEKGLAEIWPDLGVDPRGHGHDKLKTCCLRYIKVPCAYADIAITAKSPKDEAESMRAAVSKSYPFMDYAVQNLLVHANAAQSCRLGQEQFLVQFSDSCDRWIRLYNILEKHAVRRYPPSVSCLYLFAERDLASLVPISPSLQSILVVEEARYGNPLLAAMATDSHNTVEVLFSALKLSHGDEGEGHMAQHEIRSRKSRLGPSFIFGKGTANLSTEARIVDALLHYGSQRIFTVIFPRLTATGRPKSMSMSSWQTFLADAFYQACEWAHDWAIPILCAAGVDPTTLGPERFVPNGMIENWSPLGVAASFGNVSTIHTLYQHGARDDVPCSDGMHPLQLAARKGHLLAMHALMEHGADIEAADRYGYRALHGASLFHHEQAVRLLLECGASVGAEDARGQTPLHHAARQAGDGIAIARLLLRYGASVDKRDNNGCTALHHAVMHYVILDEACSELITFLVQEGEANVNNQDDAGRTPLSYTAVKDGFQGHLEIMKLFIFLGSSIALPDKGGREPLSWASEAYDNADTIRILLQHGAAIEARDHKGMTALMYAAENGQHTNVKVLIELGASLTASNDDGFTALELASALEWGDRSLRPFNSNFAAVIELLKSYGAKSRIPERVKELWS